MSEEKPSQENLEQAIKDLTPTEQEVNLAIREVMEELTAFPYVSTRLTARLNYRSALGKLHSQGYITYPFDIGVDYSLNPAGWEYWERLRLGATRYWLKNNWFPFIVAVVAVGTLVISTISVLTR